MIFQSFGVASDSARNVALSGLWMDMRFALQLKYD